MVAIIPARGGSKGLPGKNIKMMNGIPLIAYTIEAAKRVPEITTIFVSTDDPSIAEVAIAYGAECPSLRPSFLANDEAKSIDVYNYVLNELSSSKEELSEVIILQPTSPLRTSEHIQNAISLFRNKRADSVVSYCEESHPIVWHKYLNQDGGFVNIFDSQINNRQDERKSFYPNGAIYIFKSELLKKGMYYTEKSYAYLMQKRHSVDIDTIDDFEYAEFLIQKSV